MAKALAKLGTESLENAQVFDGVALQGYLLKTEKENVLSGLSLVRMVIGVWFWLSGDQRPRHLYAETDPFIHDGKRLLPSPKPFAPVKVCLEAGLNPHNKEHLARAWVDLLDAFDPSELWGFGEAA